jgi:hypothetical protein
MSATKFALTGDVSILDDMEITYLFRYILSNEATRMIVDL